MSINNIGAIFSIKDNFTSEASKIASSAKATEGAISKTGESAKATGFSIQDLGKKAGGVGKKMTAGLTLPIVGVGVAAMKIVGDFDDAMASVQKISGATGKEFDDLRDKAKELGSTTAYSAKENWSVDEKSAA